MVVMAMITDVKVLEKILNHLRLPATPPPIAPVRMDPQADLDLDIDLDIDQSQHIDIDQSQLPQGLLANSRAPP
jgi:hypothetical protein